MLKYNIYTILPAVIHFHGTDGCEDFTPIFFVEGNQLIPFSELIDNMVFKWPMYAVNDLKANIFGGFLLFPFSNGCNNQQNNLCNIHAGILIWNLWTDLDDLTI